MVVATPSKSRQLVKLLRYLVEVGGGRGEAVEDVLRELREEGWLPHPCLPAGWGERGRARGCTSSPTPRPSASTAPWWRRWAACGGRASAGPPWPGSWSSTVASPTGWRRRG